MTMGNAREPFAQLCWVRQQLAVVELQLNAKQVRSLCADSISLEKIFPLCITEACSRAWGGAQVLQRSSQQSPRVAAGRRAVPCATSPKGQSSDGQVSGNTLKKKSLWSVRELNDISSPANYRQR